MDSYGCFIYNPYYFSLYFGFFNIYRVWFLIDARRRGKLPPKAVPPCLMCVIY